MDNQNKLPDEFKYTPESELGKKLDNFWYYHKWKVLACVFILFVITVCAIQCATREDYNVRILYGGAFSSSNEKYPDMKDSFSKVPSESIDKDGAGLTVMEIYSKDYMLQNEGKVNATTNSSNYDSLCNLITTGEYSVVLLDKWIYDEIKSRVGMRAVAELCPDYASSDKLYDECAVYFTKTEFYERFSGVFGDVSDDTVICLCIYSPFKTTVGCGGSGVDRDYADAEQYFKDILNYKK